MKKYTLYSLALLVSIISSPISLFAYNAALVASIHDDEVTRVVTMADVAQVAYINTGPKTLPDAASSTKTFNVDGAYERLNQSDESATNIITAPEIKSQEDLEKFAKTVAINNSDIALITVATDTVSLTRITPVKLFGVLHLTVKETVQVISWGDGTNAVQVSSPWWGIFSTYSFDNQELSNNIYRRMKSIPPTLFTPKLTATTKALIINEIQNAFKETASL